MSRTSSTATLGLWGPAASIAESNRVVSMIASLDSNSPAGDGRRSGGRDSWSATLPQENTEGEPAIGLSAIVAGDQVQNAIPIKIAARYCNWIIPRAEGQIRRGSKPAIAEPKVDRDRARTETVSDR